MEIIFQTVIETLKDIFHIFSDDTSIKIFLGIAIGVYADRRYHKRQFEHKVYDKMVDSVSEVHTEVIEYFANMKLYIVTQDNDILEELEEQKNKFITLVFTKIPFFPKPLYNQLKVSLLDLHSKARQGEEITQEDMTSAMIAYFDAVRNEIGMEPLGESLKETW